MTMAPSSCAGMLAKAPLKEPTGGARGAGDDDCVEAGMFVSTWCSSGMSRIQACSCPFRTRQSNRNGQRQPARRPGRHHLLSMLRSIFCSAPSDPALHKKLSSAVLLRISLVGRRNGYRPLTRAAGLHWEEADARKRRSGRHQEIRQPSPLQHRHQHLCDARGPGRDGEARRGFHRAGRQDPATTSLIRC